MKRIFFSAAIIFISASSSAQGVAININGASSDASAMLDISSHDKGLLIPRLRTIERTSMPVLAQGLIVYDIDTKSIWYYDAGSWKEVLNSGGAVIPNGLAGGDLAGNYPGPTVVKIRNLDVSPVFPFDKQVMKWDMINNEWKASNDSLFLPYRAVYSDPDKLFSVTNTSLANTGAAIYGKRTNAGSGMSIANTTGVWGDDATGAGITGTGNTGLGVYGMSVQNHGINGWTTAPGFAGVYGNNAALNAYGVMGEVTGKGYAIYGKSTGTFGKAGVFENTNILNTDTVVKIVQSGNGMGTYIFSGAGAISPAMQLDNNGENYGIKLNNNNSGSFSKDALLVNNNSNGYAINAVSAGFGGAANFSVTNTATGSSLINAVSGGLGAGLVLNLSNLSGFGNVIDAYTSGAGTGINVKSNKGIAAKIGNDNAANASETLNANNIGRGSVAIFTKNNTGGSISDIQLPAVLIDNTSKGDALKISSLHAPSISHGINVNYDGLGFGINAVSTLKGIHAASGSSSGISIAAENYAGGMAIKGIASSSLYGGVIGENNHDLGVGVLGTSTGQAGIGIKGTNSTVANIDYVGAVTGINSSTGIGVYGESQNGTGVKGLSNASGANAVYGRNTAGGDGVYGESIGAFASGILGLAQPTNGTLGVGVTGQSWNFGDGVRGFGGLGGNGVSGFADNNSSGNGLYGEINGGTGYAVKGSSNISTRAAILGLNSAGDGVAGTSNGPGNGISGTAGTTGAGIYGSSNPISSTGRAALFDIPAATNAYDAVQIFTHGAGANLYLKNFLAGNSATMMTMTNSGSGNFLVLENGAGANKIRFDNTGKGFFNGGTQSGGADMAEVFDVSGNRNDYEAGDVLVIDTGKDRTVIRSTTSYSNLVAGVYATKPGMLMSEENIDSDLSAKVPMGMVGVIPTKVCLEGGEIRRGDFIVTSSATGIAMKADMGRVRPGQIIGKALENYSADGIGKIKVLVNVK